MVNQLLIGCADEPEANANKNLSNARPAPTFDSAREGVKDNKDELSSLIKMPFEPEDLAWKEFAPDKNGRRLLVVFQLLPDDSRRLADRLAKSGNGAPVTIKVEKWYPTELITGNEVTGEEGLAATSYPATDFFQQPFLEGTVARVGTSDFFVLDLMARQ